MPQWYGQSIPFLIPDVKHLQLNFLCSRPQLAHFFAMPGEGQGDTHMLGNLQYRQYVTLKHQLSNSAIEYIDLARSSDPSRTVGINARTNIVAADVSIKMHATIASESHAERSVALLLEYDSAVLEFWDQPPTIKIQKSNKRKALRWTTYTADFLVLRISGPEVIEVKTLDEAEKLVVDDPLNWTKNGNTFEYIPAREAFKNEYGINFRVVITNKQEQQIAENIRILLASRDHPRYSPILANKAQGLLSHHPVWRLDELNEALEERDYTSIIQLIDSGVLAFNQASASLSDPEICYVASDSALLTQCINTDEISTNGEQIEQVPLQLSPSGVIAERVLNRLTRIEMGEKSSSVRRWKKQIAEGTQKGLTPFQSLINKDRNISGRDAKLPKEVADFLEYFATEVRLNMAAESLLQIYFEYCSQAKLTHPEFAAVSKGTFYTRMAKITPELIGYAKGGKRMAMALAAPTDPKKRHIVSTLPWMKASVDHYNVDICLVVFEDNDNIYTARPWLSTMVDVATSEILAFAISFQDPSRRSCAKLIRECVRRHGKLPREILTDHGSDFTSVYFRSLLANYRVTHSLRPAANPRSGSEVERFFGAFRSEWLCARPGFIVNLKTLRQIDGKKAPEKSAVMTVEDLYAELTQYLGWRSSKPRGASVKSSSVQYQEMMEKFPFVAMSVKYDDVFMLATSVESNDYKIDFQRGIHIKDLHYTCPELIQLQGVRSTVEVRIDPEIPYIIYVKINDKWHSAYQRNFERYVNQTLNNRIATGILVSECYAWRRKISDAKGVELADLRHECDKVIEQRITTENAIEASLVSADTDYPVLPDISMPNEDHFTTRCIPTEKW